MQRGSLKISTHYQIGLGLMELTTRDDEFGIYDSESDSNESRLPPRVWVFEVEVFLSIQEVSQQQFSSSAREARFLQPHLTLTALP